MFSANFHPLSKEKKNNPRHTEKIPNILFTLLFFYSNALLQYTKVFYVCFCFLLHLEFNSVHLFHKRKKSFASHANGWFPLWYNITSCFILGLKCTFKFIIKVDKTKSKFKTVIKRIKWETTTLETTSWSVFLPAFKYCEAWLLRQKPYCNWGSPSVRFVGLFFKFWIVFLANYRKIHYI